MCIEHLMIDALSSLVREFVVPHNLPAFSLKLKMIVADILISNNDDGDGDPTMLQRRTTREGLKVLDYLLPRSIFASCFSSLNKSKRRRALKSQKVDRETGGVKVEGSMHSTNETSKDGSSASVSQVSEGELEGAAESGRYKCDASFNLGVGFGLISFLVATKIELNKMVELREQIELLLQNVKEDLHKKGTFIKPSKSTTPCNQVLASFSSIQEECTGGILELETEFEAELQRLWDSENFSGQLQNQSTEIIVQDSAPDGSRSVSFGKVIDPQPQEANMKLEGNFGVPPYELERRLHELLEERQQEQIKELESALECAKWKIRKAELEVAWWKDTTNLMSQHVQKSSHFSR